MSVSDHFVTVCINRITVTFLKNGFHCEWLCVSITKYSLKLLSKIPVEIESDIRNCLVA